METKGNFNIQIHPQSFAPYQVLLSYPTLDCCSKKEVLHGVELMVEHLNN
jgi:hypothetical protein